MYPPLITRRQWLGAAAASPAVLSAAQARKIPVGLELYSVRDLMKDDLMGTVRQVAQLGYEGVEFYSPYFDWTPAYAKEVRKLLDEVGMRCFSTHNGARSFQPENIDKAIELNQILGSKFIIMASAGKVDGIDGWKKVAEQLNFAAEKMKPAGLRAGFHNHQVEFRPINLVRPMDVLARNTRKHVSLQLDVGTCLEAGVDPVEWIRKNKGRITSMHLKEWSSNPAVGYKALMGEGEAPWKKIFEAAEKVGGIEFYLIEQEGSRYSSMETARKSLEIYRQLRGMAS